MFLQEISSQPSRKRSFFNIKRVETRLDINTPTISLFSTPLNLQELITSTAFDGYMGIQSTNEMDVCCPNHSFSPEPKKERGNF